MARCFMEHTYRNNCLPDKIISDSDLVFISMLWKRPFDILDIKISLLTAYHLQADEQTEIVRRKLEDMICRFVNCDNDNLDEHLVELEFPYNASVYTTTGIHLSSLIMVLTLDSFQQN